jgi:hypothetical protein
VGPSVEQKFDRQAAPRLHARLVEAMDDAHHVAAAIGTEDVSCGSLAVIPRCLHDVRFAPNKGH